MSTIHVFDDRISRHAVTAPAPANHARFHGRYGAVTQSRRPLRNLERNFRAIKQARHRAFALDSTQSTLARLCGSGEARHGRQNGQNGGPGGCLGPLPSLGAEYDPPPLEYTYSGLYSGAFGIQIRVFHTYSTYSIVFHRIPVEYQGFPRSGWNTGIRLHNLGM